jgi:hypothetical protein
VHFLGSTPGIIGGKGGGARGGHTATGGIILLNAGVYPSQNLFDSLSPSLEKFVLEDNALSKILICS